jgi:hypothetical protein
MNGLSKSSVGLHCFRFRRCDTWHFNIVYRYVTTWNVTATFTIRLVYNHDHSSCLDECQTNHKATQCLKFEQFFFFQNLFNDRLTSQLNFQQYFIIVLLHTFNVVVSSGICVSIIHVPQDRPEGTIDVVAFEVGYELRDTRDTTPESSNSAWWPH